MSNLAPTVVKPTTSIGWWEHLTRFGCDALPKIYPVLSPDDKLTTFQSYSSCDGTQNVVARFFGGAEGRKTEQTDFDSNDAKRFPPRKGDSVGEELERILLGSKTHVLCFAHIGAGHYFTIVRDGSTYALIQGWEKIYSARCYRLSEELKCPFAKPFDAKGLKELVKLLVAFSREEKSKDALEYMHCIFGFRPGQIEGGTIGSSPQIEFSSCSFQIWSCTYDPKKCMKEAEKLEQELAKVGLKVAILQKKSGEFDGCSSGCRSRLSKLAFTKPK